MRESILDTDDRRNILRKAEFLRMWRVEAAVEIGVIETCRARAENEIAGEQESAHTCYRNGDLLQNSHSDAPFSGSMPARDQS